MVFSCRSPDSLVLLGLQLLLPGLVQVNQSLVVENKENEVQSVCGDADDAEVLQDKVEDVTQVERAHHRQDGCRHEDEGGHCTDSHPYGEKHKLTKASSKHKREEKTNNSDTPTSC